MNPLGWYPGSNVQSFNVYYKPLYTELKSLKEGVDLSKLKWKSEITLRSNYNPPNVGDNPQKAIYSEKLKWNAQSKLKNILWENYDYKRQLNDQASIKLSKVDSDRIPEDEENLTTLRQRRPRLPTLQPQKQQNSKDYQSYYSSHNPKQPSSNYNDPQSTNYHDSNRSLTDSGTDLSYTKYIKIGRKKPSEYLFGKKQSEAERIAMQFQKFKATRRMKLADRSPNHQLDPTKVNSIQSFSKYKDTLPQIHQKVGHAQTDRPAYQEQQNHNYYNPGYLSDRSIGNKSSRSNYKEQIIRKKFVVPEIKHSNLKRFQWDQDLKKRAKSQLQNEMTKSNEAINFFFNSNTVKMLIWRRFWVVF